MLVRVMTWLDDFELLCDELVPLATVTVCILVPYYAALWIGGVL